MDSLRGKIIKATAGFYYVHCGDAGEFTCHARGIFRKNNITPLVGDDVVIQPEEDGTGTVTDILARKNAIVRPPLANLDAMVLVLSITDPAPNLFIVDKFLAILEKKAIAPIIVITKSDLEDTSELEALYTGVGYPVFVVSAKTGAGVDALVAALAGKVSAFSGNSGVGKSSLLNAIDADFAIEVGVTSKKLGRGKHTTRHVELFRLASGALVADTPGFSSMNLIEMGGLDKDELADCFREFAPYLGKCQFVNCAHKCEKGCAVLEALADGKIDARRHTNYRQLYDEVKDVKAWEQKS